MGPGEKGTCLVDLVASGEGSACAISDAYVAVGTQSGGFDVWEIATKKDEAGGQVFAGAYVSAMAFSPDGTTLLMGGSAGKIVRLDAGRKWTCTKEWDDVPPKPIATNDIRFAADGKRWVAAHSDDRASLFAAHADPSPRSLGNAFWLEKKPWSTDFIVSSACFVPGTKAIVTAHFDKRLRVFVERMPGVLLRAGDVVFDDATGAPTTFGPIGQAFPAVAAADAPKPKTKTEPKPKPKPEPEPKPKPNENAVVIAIGDREHRARSLEEMELAASLHPCATCGAAPKGLTLVGDGEERTLLGACRFCATPAAFRFVVEGDPKKTMPRRHEVGDDRPSTIIEPRALTSELARLVEQGIDDSTRDRALTCIVELLKFPLVRDGERGEGLRAERDRLLADEKKAAPLLATGTPQADIDAIVRALFSGEPPGSLGALESALGIRADIDASKVWTGPTDVALAGFVRHLSFVVLWDIHHHERPKDAEDLRRRFALSEWTAILAGGATTFQQALRRIHGPPRAEPHCHVYGNSWVVATRGEEIKLTWARRTPDWAHSVDARVRERALVALARAVHRARDGGELASAASAIPPDAGIRPRASNADGLSFELVPAMSTLELARIFGWPEVVAQAVDVHASVWNVLVPAGNGDEVIGPRIGRWNVRLGPDGRPSGGDHPSPALRRIPGGTRLFAPEDLVRRLQIGA